MLLYLVLLFMCFHYGRSENCTFLDTFNNQKGLMITFENVSISKLCTGEELNYTPTYTFYNCKITELGTHLFKNYQIDYVSISKNTIRNLNRYTFYNINIMTIILEDDGIEYIEEHSFYNLSELSRLVLSNNKITMLNPSSFDQMPSLETFLINDNQISKLFWDTFNHTNTNILNEIDISNNHIQEIEPKCFRNMRLKYVEFSNNSFQILNRSSFINCTFVKFYVKYMKMDIVRNVCTKNINVTFIIATCNHTSSRLCVFDGRFCDVIDGRVYLILPVVLLCVLITAIASNC